MRHLIHGRRLNVDSQHRLAMRRNLARSLFLSGRIVTTPAKAKAVRPYVEKLVTRARKAVALKATDPAGYVHQLRVLAREIHDKKVLRLLVEKIAPLFLTRPGGYTRIMLDTRHQIGDNAPRAVFEFVTRPAPDADSEGEASKKEGEGTEGKAGGKAPLKPGKVTAKAGKAAAPKGKAPVKPGKGAAAS